MESIGKRIKYARELRGLNQTALSKLVGIKQPTLSTLESGANKTTNKIMEFATALKVSPEWLALGKGPMESSHESPDLAEDEKQLIKIFRKLSADKRQELLGIAKVVRMTSFSGDKQSYDEWEKSLESGKPLEKSKNI